MNAIRRQVDAVLNQFTMYRGLLYGLATLLACAEVMALSGVIGISALGLLLSLVVLVVSCYAANKLFSVYFKIPSNYESWLITALILACILPPSTSVSRLLLIGLAGALAMASKYLLVVRGSPIFNPAATGAFILSIIGLLPATWWIATPPLAPIAGIVGLLVLYKQRKFSLFLAFSLMAVGLLLYSGVVLRDQSLLTAFSNAWLSWPIIFLGTIMLTEPSTLPRGRYLQILTGLLVGIVFASQLSVGPLSATPQFALLVGNLFVFVFAPAAGYLLKLKHQREVASGIHEFTFHKPRGLTFTAGEYMEWTLPHSQTDSRGNRRIFSMSSAPKSDELSFAVRISSKRSSSFKKALLNLQPGQIIRAAHVDGEFVIPADSAQPLLLVAGGIGVTPFVSMLRTIIDRQTRVNMQLIYIVGGEASFAFKDVIAVAKQYGVTTTHVTRRVTVSEIQQLVPDLHHRIAYISGPDAMVTNYAQQLAKLGENAPRLIKTDHFSGY